MLGLLLFVVIAGAALWALTELVALPRPIYVLLVLVVVVVFVYLLLGVVGDLDLDNDRAALLL